jgi:hypothetical protein
MSQMMGVLTDWQVGQFIAQLLSGKQYVSLHRAYPGIGSPTDTEIPGSSYSRQPATFIAVGARAIRTTTLLSWPSLSETVVTHLGIWDNSHGGNLRAVITLVNPVYVAEGGTYQLAAGDLYYRWP